MSQAQSDRSSPETSTNDHSRITLSIEWNTNPNTVPLLCVPLRVISSICTKPRKWLMYVATVICGVDGELRYFSANEGISGQEMENGIKGGDHFVFRLSGEPNFIDWGMRDCRCSRSSVTTESREVPLKLKDYYGGCPFSKLGLSQACHFVPSCEKTEYLRKVLRARGDADDEITIGSNQNMIVLSPSLHVAFDIKAIGFLKTPNKFLKTNEILGLENEKDESYCVTVHYYGHDEEEGPGLHHCAHSDLAKGSGLRRPVAVGEYDPCDYRPKDILFDLSYVSGLLSQWGHEEGGSLLAEYSKRHFGETVKRREELEAQVRESARRRRREQNNAKRDSTPAQLDGFDIILLMHYLVRNTTPEEVDAEIARHRREEEEDKADRLNAWGNELFEGKTLRPPEELESPDTYISLPDGDEEMPVSIEDALSRPAPSYSIPSVPSLAIPSSADPDEFANVSDSELYEDS